MGIEAGTPLARIEATALKFERLPPELKPLSPVDLDFATGTAASALIIGETTVRCQTEGAINKQLTAGTEDEKKARAQTIVEIEEQLDQTPSKLPQDAAEEQINPQVIRNLDYVIAATECQPDTTAEGFKKIDQKQLHDGAVATRSKLENTTLVVFTKTDASTEAVTLAEWNKTLDATATTLPGYDSNADALTKFYFRRQAEKKLIAEKGKMKVVFVSEAKPADKPITAEKLTIEKRVDIADRAASAILHASVELARDKPEGNWRFVVLGIQQIRLKAVLADTNATAQDKDIAASLVTSAARACYEANSRLQDNQEANVTNARLSENIDHYKVLGNDPLRAQLEGICRSMGIDEKEPPGVMTALKSGQLNISNIERFIPTLKTAIEKDAKNRKPGVPSAVKEVLATAARTEEISADEGEFIYQMYRYGNLEIFQGQLSKMLGMDKNELVELANPVKYLENRIGQLAENAGYKTPDMNATQEGTSKEIQLAYQEATRKYQETLEVIRKLFTLTPEQLNEMKVNPDRNFSTWALGIATLLPMLVGVMGAGGGEEETNAAKQGR